MDETPTAHAEAVNLKEVGFPLEPEDAASRTEADAYRHGSHINGYGPHGVIGSLGDARGDRQQDKGRHGQTKKNPVCALFPFLSLLG